jgi:hypothetical protein
MASAVLGTPQRGLVPMGQNGRRHQWGTAAFTTTGTTCTIPVDLRVVEAVILTPVTTPATDETLSWGDTLGTDGKFTVGATGNVTVSRTGASKTSGLQFSYLIIGW